MKNRIEDDEPVASVQDYLDCLEEVVRRVKHVFPNPAKAGSTFDIITCMAITETTQQEWSKKTEQKIEKRRKENPVDEGIRFLSKRGNA